MQIEFNVSGVAESEKSDTEAPVVQNGVVAPNVNARRDYVPHPVDENLEAEYDSDEEVEEQEEEEEEQEEEDEEVEEPEEPEEGERHEQIEIGGDDVADDEGVANKRARLE